MQHRSNDRETFCESSRTPAPSGAGASSSGPDRLLRALVHDTANWLQRLEAPLRQLETRLPADDPAVAQLRAGLSRCAELGRETLEALSGDTGWHRSSLREAVEAFVLEEARLDPTRSPLRIEGDLPASARVPLSSGTLQNLLLNLVENAREASDPATEIRLELRALPQAVELCVHDRGVGMDTLTLERCFEPGHSRHDDPARGVGLASVRDTLRRVGGTVVLHSEPGHGTTAVVTLPRAEAEPPRSLSSETEGLSPRTILLVEDDGPVREVVGEMLRVGGHRVVTAGTARQAWAILEEQTVDAVILDQGLPDAPGQDVAEGIRQENPDLVLVLLTGDARAVAPRQLPPALDAVGVKPLGLEELHSLLEDAFVRAERRRSPRERARPARG